MKLLTRDTDYAVRVLRYLAESRTNGLVSAREIQKELKMTWPFTRKIMQTLRKGGVLTSYRGKGGGFLLGLAPDKIYLVDLIRIFHGRFRFSECLFKKGICPDRSDCILKQRIREIEHLVYRKLKEITIASLRRK